MKKIIVALAAITAGLFIQGCASTQVADELNGQKISTCPKAQNVAHVYGDNWGIYCLSIPLLSGSIDKPGSIVWMQDTVNVKAVTKMVTARSKELGADSTVDLKSNASSFWIMPGIVLFFRSVEVSGNATKAATPAK